jgi:hypothetical protein
MRESLRIALIVEGALSKTRDLVFQAPHEGCGIVRLEGLEPPTF